MNRLSAHDHKTHGKKVNQWTLRIMESGIGFGNFSIEEDKEGR